MTRKKPPHQEKSSTATTTDTPATARGTETASEKPCYIVAIGASAGGQGALEHLFTVMPPDCGVSFVVIMHLPPEGPSFLADMLRRYTAMEVVTAEEGMRLAPDMVYVIPAGRELTVNDGRLRLHEASKQRHPIDRLFHSLAAEAARQTIAVVLSGFGTDGAEGVKRVKEGGGIVIVQEPGSAINHAMPDSAIATGAADLILPAEEIPAKIAEIVRGTCTIPTRSCLTATLDEELANLFDIVKAKTGNDFSSYKMNTVMRRIERRMAVNEVGGIKKYIALLQECPQEAHALAQDILIGVTSFFRDPEAFEILKNEIIPRLFANRGPDEPVRIWHACCATGEEVYSMAFLIREYLDQEKISATVQLFATDIDEGAIAQARAGLYPDDIAAEVGDERLKTFFTRSDNRWQVVKRVREMIVFAHHSLIKNPPFSRLDLLVCRNFLIYLNPDMQKRLISMFHQVLKPEGFLFLGSSETVGRHSDLFTPFDKKWKIFQRQENGRRTEALFPFTTPVRYYPGTGRHVRPAEVFEPSPGATAEKLLMERYSPPCVVVNEKYEVVYVSSRLNRYLEVPVGEPTRDILRMARAELRPALRAAIYKAFTDQKEVVFRGVKIAVAGGEAQVNVLVEPVTAPPPAERLAMVVFEPALPPTVCPAPAGAGEAPAGDDAARDTLVRQLEEQLRITHEQLQAVTEHLESSNEGFLSANEELISMNEEFQSANEELQSTNEELETSKEELQALNEELVTVNAELQGKVEELNQANGDMENLLASSGIATIFLDRKLNIKGFTPAVAGIFNLISADVGRPFRHLAGKIDWPTLTQDAETVLSGQPFAEREVTTLDRERCYLKRIFPYRTQKGSIDGVVITFIDITEHKRAQGALRESEKRYHSLFENMMEGFAYCKMLYDDQGTPVDFVYLDVNDAFARLTGLENVKGKKVTEVIPGIRESSQELFDIYSRVALTGQPERFEIDFKPLSAWLSVSVYSMEREYFVAVFDDITERKRAEDVTCARLRMLTTAPVLSMDETLQMALDDIEAQTGSVIGFYHFLEPNQETLSLQTWSSNTLGSMCTAEGKGSHYPVSQAGVWVDCVSERRPVIHNDYAALTHKKGMPSGHAPVVREMLIPIVREDRIVAIIGVGNKPTEYNATDIEIASLLGDFSWEIVERKRAEGALRRAKEEWERTFDSVPDLIAIMDDRHRIVRANRAMAERLGVTPEECVGQSCYRSVHGADAPVGSCPHVMTLADEREHMAEVHEERLGGDFLVTTTPLLDERGEMIGTVHVARDITERKRAEDEMRQSEERYRTLFDTLIEGFCIIEVLFDADERPIDYRFLECNPAFEAQTGLRNAQGKLMRELAPEHEAHWFEIYGKVALTGESARFVNEAKALNRWYDVSAYRVGEEDSRKVAILFNDITEARRAEEALHRAHDELEERVTDRTEELASAINVLQEEIVERERAEEGIRRLNRLYAVLSETNQAIVRAADSDSLFRDFCRIAVEDGGFMLSWVGLVDTETGRVKIAAAHGATGYLDDIRISTNDEPEGEGPTGKSIREGSYYISNDFLNDPCTRPWHDKGRVHGIRATASIVLKKEEVAIGALTLYANEKDFFDQQQVELLRQMGADISFAMGNMEREKRLLESEGKFRTLFEESKDVIYIMDADQRLVDINRAGCELFGYSKEELLSLDIVDIYCNPAERERFIQDLFAMGYARDFEACMYKKGGESLHVLNTASVIRTDQGEIAGYRGIIHDVTGRKRLEHQLLQSQKMESIGLLAGGVAHDFNNLLTAISGYSQIIRDQFAAGDEMLAMCIEQVMAATERAVELTRNLLAFSRKQIINPQPIQVNGLVISVGKLLTRIIGEDIELGTQLAGEELTVMADKGQIDQVLVNLATNARDAMPQGGRLLIGTDRAELDRKAAQRYDLDKGGRYALISVSDSGHGMDKETMARIFEPFFTTKETGKGTGLGLSIIYGIVKQHNGTITVESEPGKGSTFTVYLPLVAAAADEAQKDEVFPVSGGIETILLAEDDPMVRKYMQKILEMAGYSLITARNGVEAVEQFRENRDRIALVLCDVVMPKKNGKEVYDEIRAMDPQVRFLFTSGYNDEIIHTKGILLEEIAFIEKPVNRQALLAKLREMLDA